MPDHSRSSQIRIVLGFDYGHKKIGLAVGQTITRTANALQITKNRNGKPDWATIDRIVASWKPDALIVGIPLDMDDSHTDATTGAKKFARRLEARYRKPTMMADERLTSIVARMDNGLYGDDEVDDVAAKLILETWLSEYDRDH